MKLSEYEHTMRASQFTHLEKIHTGHGDILLAERKATANSYHGVTGGLIEFWQVAWAVARDEIVDVGQTLNMDTHAEIEGVYRAKTQRERREEALKEAENWIRDGRIVGRH